MEADYDSQLALNDLVRCLAHRSELPVRDDLRRGLYSTHSEDQPGSAVPSGKFAKA